MPLLERRTSKRIGEILLEKEACSYEDIEKALEVQRKFGGRLGNILINLGAITEKDLLEALAEQFKIPLLLDIPDKKYQIITDKVKKETLRKLKLCPLKEGDKSILLITDPLNISGILYIKNLIPHDFSFVLTTSEVIDTLLSPEEDLRFTITQEDLEKLKELALEAPVIKLVNQLIIKAVELDASDIHFEAFKDKLKVRFRVDGILRTVDIIPGSLKLPVITRLKLISNMDISENRLPQDGRISLRIAGKELDIRASSLPTKFGESFVLRILKKSSIELSLPKLGFFDDHVQTIRKIARKSYGIFLTTGPTGSGKTTTLYSLLKELNRDEVKIITVEDPVEYELEGINQVNVNPDINLTFANVLRNILRQDPDIIMIGEIRDSDTAEIAVQAALTGHLVLSTLHTNNAISAINRLKDLGVPSFLIKNALIGIMAQRLVRKPCPFCSEKTDIKQIKKSYPEYSELIDKMARSIPKSKVNPKKISGCNKCNYTGYLGRTVIAEVIETNTDFWIKFETTDFLSPKDLNKRSILEDGILKSLLGLTTISEVIRVC